MQYELDINSWELTEREKEYLRACDALVENRYSLRECARNELVSKSSLHRFIHNELPCLSYELSGCCDRQLKDNKLNQRRFRKGR